MLRFRLLMALFGLAAILLHVGGGSGLQAPKAAGGPEVETARSGPPSSGRYCGVTYGSSAEVVIPTQGPASPYPYTLRVSGVASPIDYIYVDLTSFTHSFPDDVDVLLVGPQGQATMILSDAGGGGDITNHFIRLDDAAGATIPDDGPIPVSPATVRPVDYALEGADLMPAPAPAGPYSSSLSVFHGTNPNGTWKLFVNDDFSADGGTVRMQFYVNSECPKCFGVEAQTIGTAGPDTIEAFQEPLHTLGGDDIITEYDSDSERRICSGAGNDTLNGGPDVERICAGGNGTDTATACDGNVVGVP